MRRRTLLALIAALGACVATSAPAQAATGGPDAQGYTYVDSTSAGGPAAGPFGSIRGVGTDIGNHCDDCFTEIDAPFDVGFYHDDTPILNVSSNGNIQFDSASTAYGATGLPYGVFMTALLPFQADLRTDAGGGVYTRTSGTAPNRQFTVEWDATAFAGGAAEDFQVVFTEGSRAIQFRYLNVNAGVAHTVGIQGFDGSRGNHLQYNTGGQDVANNLAIAFDDSTTNTYLSLLAAPSSSSTFGQSVTLTVYVQRYGGGAPETSGSVTFGRADGPLATKALNSQGKAVLTTTKLPAGYGDLWARYGGSGSDTASYAEIGYAVAPAGTTTAIAGGGTVAYGTPITATVKPVKPGAGTATGTVQWSDQLSGRTLATTALRGGMATLPPTSVRAGSSYDLVAYYSGSSNADYQPSHSGEVTVTVDEASTSTKLAVAPNPAKHGAKVILTATVKPQYAGTTPTGSVGFYDSGTAIGGAALVNGVAKFTTTTLPVGSHPIHVEYYGDANFIGSSSGTVTVTIT